MTQAEVSYTLAAMQDWQLEEVRDFLRVQFPPDGPQNRGGWLEWQVANPDGARVQLVLADAKIVALSIFLPVRLRLEQVDYTAAFSTNTMVAPEFRRCGLGKRIHSSRVETYDFALSSGQSEANSRLYEKMGFACLGHYRKICMVRRFPFPYLKKHYLRELFSYVKWRFRSRVWERGTRVEVYSEVPENLPSAFFENRFLTSTIEPRSSRERLIWRYQRHPYFTYEFVLVFQKNETRGLAVVRPDREELFLVDVCAEHADVPIVLAAVARHLPFRKAVGYFAGAELAGHFAAAGWYTHRDESRLLGYTRRDELRALLQRQDAFCFFGGDSDKER